MEGRESYPFPGPHPLDADSLDLALFAVGWKLLLRDLSFGLPPERSRAVELALEAAGVHDAFVLRDNMVGFKKVLLGIFRSNLALTHDLRRLATFFREPPATFSEEPATCGSRAFFRPSRYRELCDALCTTEGALGGVVDARRYCKAICCVPRHPDAPRSCPRPFGQPFAHYRCAGLLSEPLPEAMKGWRLLQDACSALCVGDEPAAQPNQIPSSPTAADPTPPQPATRCLRDVLTAAAHDLRALPAEPDSGFGALLEAVRALGLSPEEERYTRCVIIARGGAKALAVSAEAARLAAALRVMLGVCIAAEAAVAAAGGAEAPRAQWASELQRRADDEQDAAPSDGIPPDGIPPDGSERTATRTSRLPILVPVGEAACRCGMTNMSRKYDCGGGGSGMPWDGTGMG